MRKTLNLRRANRKRRPDAVERQLREMQSDLDTMPRRAFWAKWSPTMLDEKAAAGKASLSVVGASGQPDPDRRLPDPALLRVLDPELSMVLRGLHDTRFAIHHPAGLHALSALQLAVSHTVARENPEGRGMIVTTYWDLTPAGTELAKRLSRP